MDTTILANANAWRYAYKRQNIKYGFVDMANPKYTGYW